MWTYTTKAKVNQLSQIPVADLRDEWSDWAESLIDEYEGTTYQAKTTYTETYSGDGTGILLLKHTPIDSVISVNIDGASCSPDSYAVYTDHIELISTVSSEISEAIISNAVFPVGEKNITVTYVAGSATVPKRVEFAATQMIATIAAVYKREGSDVSIKYSRSTQQADETITERYSLQSALNSIMKSYLKRKRQMR